MKFEQWRAKALEEDSAKGCYKNNIKYIHSNQIKLWESVEDEYTCKKHDIENCLSCRFTITEGKGVPQ